MNYGIVNQAQLEDIKTAMLESLISKGVECVILLDKAGNTIATADNGACDYDIYAFTALGAGNFATVESMANLVGENDFSQFFHTGEKTNIHFCKVDDNLLLVSIFGKELSLGYLRLNVADLVHKIRLICRQGRESGQMN
jgi:predicted regulator of Ras-like GTPase activity (Roadblock/LC7/MglB family)